MTHVQFAQPHWLWIGALCCAAVVILFARAARLGRRDAARLAGRRFVTSASRRRRLARQVLLLAGVAAVFTALARPQWGFRWEEERREGIDLMFAVDTSKSMGATDLRPDRLTRAKLAVSDLLRAFPGERVGLIAFAGDAFVQAPMTIDQAIFAESLEALDTSVIPRGGTDIGAAIRTAVQAMASEPERRKVLVILSDGEDLQGEAATAAAEAARAGLVIYTVGVGTPAGELIAVERKGERDFVRDADGQPVRSRLDEATLQRVAQATGGAYAPLGAGGGGLDLLYRQYLSRLPRHAVEERMRKVYTERFQLPLGLAVACLLGELIISDRARRRVSRTGAGRPGSTSGAGAPPVRTRPLSRPGATVAVLSVVLLTAGWPGRPARAAGSGAAPAGGEPRADVAGYNAGTDAYRKKDFAAARERFQGATHTTDIAVQADAYYDLGNARYRLGQASLAKDEKAAAIEAWKGAVAAYDGALALRKNDEDARFNRDLVARRLKALEDEAHRNQQDQRKQNQQQSAGARSRDRSSPSGSKPGNQGQQDQQGQPQSQGERRSQGQGAPAGQRSDQGADQGQGQRQGQRGQAVRAGEGHERGDSAGAPDRATAPRTMTEGDRADARPPLPNPSTGGSDIPPRTPGPGVVSPANEAAGRRDERQRESERGSPGALSRGEANQLLDSVASELRRLPPAVGNARRAGGEEAPIKDW